MSAVTTIEAETFSKIIRRATEADLPALGRMNTKGFSGNKPEGSGEDWIRSYYDSAQFRIWISECRGVLAGYIAWRILGGFNREHTTTELEQLAVSEPFQHQGVGNDLIEETLTPVGEWIRERNIISGYVGQIVVWVDASNVAALKTYEKRFPTFGGHRCEYMRNGSRLEEVQRKGTIPIPLLRNA